MTRVELVACGTAAYASLVGAALIERWCGLPARVTVGSEFRYSPPPLDPTTLVIAVTQSGETADTIAPTRYARERGCPIVAVTNTVGSAITREADAVLFLQAGPEVAVAASKTFTTQVATLVMIAAAIAGGPRRRCRATRSGRSGGPSGRFPTPPSEPSTRAPGSARSPAATPGAAASCSSGAARRTRPPSRAPSSSRR